MLDQWLGTTPTMPEKKRSGGSHRKIRTVEIVELLIEAGWIALWFGAG